MLQILIADDHPLFRLALRHAVCGVADDAHIDEADSLEAARKKLQERPDTDLVLLDLHMPDSHGLVGLASLRAEFPTCAVVMISAHDDPATIRRALAYGAAGFIAKRAGLDELQAGLRAVLACEQWLPPGLRESVAGSPLASADDALASRLKTLSPQQFRVLALIAKGLLNKQIADALAIQERTVKAHVTAIFEKLGVRNRTQAGVLLGSLHVPDGVDRTD